MKNNESGRSMIEMLGVLAIIGVLSVGGIAGYSKAMGKFKVNKCVDQLTQIVASTRALFAGHKDYSALGTAGAGTTTKTCSTTAINGPLIKQGHLVPEDMLTTDSNGKDALENPFMGSVILSCGKKRSADTGNKAFIIIYNSVPKDLCIELATQDWGAGASSGLIGVCVNKDISGEYLGGTSAFADGNGCAVGEAMSVGNASTACKNALNSIYWKFY